MAINERANERRINSPKASGQQASRRTREKGQGCECCEPEAGLRRFIAKASAFASICLLLFCQSVLVVVE